MTELYSLHQFSVQAAGQALHAVLADNIEGLSKQKARQAIVAGLVSLDEALETKPTSLLPEQQVQIQVDLRHGLKKPQAGKTQQERPFEIIYEDDDVIVVNKAAGVLSAPSQRDDHGHVPELLRQYWRKKKITAKYIGVVHRIDQATSGCLVFALNKSAQQLLSQQFQQHVAERRYRCICQGQPQRDKDTLTGKIGRGNDGRRKAMHEEEDLGKSAITHFTVMDRFANGSSQLELRLETGRTHQIRVHLAGIGCPIIGDDVYNRSRKQADGQKSTPIRAPRLMLHAYQIAFDHPSTGERICVDAEMPKMYERFLKKMRAHKES